MKKLGFSSLVSLLLISGGVLAADAKLTSLTGSGMIDTGDGFKPLSAPADLDKGNRVLVNDDSVGTIEYENGCVQKVEGAEIVVVGESCKAGIGWLPTTTAVTAIAIGAGSMIIMDQSDSNSRQPVSP